MKNRLNSFAEKNGNSFRSFHPVPARLCTQLDDDVSNMLNDTTGEREQSDVDIFQDALDSGETPTRFTKENRNKIENGKQEPSKETETLISLQCSSQQTSRNAEPSQCVAEENVLEDTTATDSTS